MPKSLKNCFRKWHSPIGAGRSVLVWAISLLVVALSSAFVPMVYPFDANKTNIRARNQSPSMVHLLGTDQLGRDMMARVIKGGRLTLSVGLCAMCMTVFLGLLVGLLAWYFSKLDGMLMWWTDVFLSLPTLPLLLLMLLLLREPLANVFGPELGMMLLVVSAISVTSWMPTARVIRVEVMKLKHYAFVEASRLSGASHTKVLLHHILPNVVPMIAISCTVSMANAVVIESTLSFLGLGFPPDYPTWGRLLFDALEYIQLYPSRVMWPGIAISFVVIMINQLGESLNALYSAKKV